MFLIYLACSSFFFFVAVLGVLGYFPPKREKGVFNNFIEKIADTSDTYD